MTIDWFQFTPYSALFGGALIGLAASLLILFNGRIAGISGIVGGLFKPNGSGVTWRMAFIMGLVVAPLLYRAFFTVPESRIDANTVLLVIAGLFVGIGTRYGSGCTSGHGVSGLSRFSRRSLVATVVFMFFGFLTVFLTRHIIGG
ncbi:MAG TPA: YeeE/YedE thiosulfate transporter family protein [Burkholderiaceae bacterium]|nr:YeeE/YedE thiosulfate transporter family protein [Burkholderiaceae bacterium]